MTPSSPSSSPSTFLSSWPRIVIWIAEKLTEAYVEQIGDQAKSALDSVASVITPQQEKSTTQKGS